MIILGGLRTSVYKEISLLEIAGLFQLLKRHVTSITELLPPTKFIDVRPRPPLLCFDIGSTDIYTTKKNHLMVTRLNFVSLAF